MKSDRSASVSCSSASRSLLATGWLALASSVLCLTLTGCQTGVAPESLPASWRRAPDGPVTLSEGDTVKLFFPNHPEFSTVQKIRADGKLSLTGVGEIHAAGKSLSRLQSEVASRYKGQVSDFSMVSATLEAGGTPITVSVMGRISQLPADRPTTLLQALLAAGVSNDLQDTENVLLRRPFATPPENYTVNMKAALEGKDDTPIYLRGGDIVTVSE